MVVSIPQPLNPKPLNPEPLNPKPGTLTIFFAITFAFIRLLYKSEYMEKNDNQLIEEYKAGNADALGELVKKYRRPLFAYLINMTSANSDADELFQETWFKVIKKIDSYKQQNFYGWLIRISHNLTIDKIRKRKADFSLDATIGDGTTTWIDTVPAPAVNKDHIDNKKIAKNINSAIKELPTEQREVFMLRTYQGLSFKEISVIQKTSINTALARMQYSLTKLRKILKEDYHEL